MSLGSVFTPLISLVLTVLTMFSSIFALVTIKPAEEPQNEQVSSFIEKEIDTVRIMSFNIRCANVGTDSWEDRIGIVSQTILESESDSVGVQEATPEWMAALKKNIGDKYDYVGVGRDDGDNEGEYSAVFYLKDKYTVEDSGTFWLSKTPEKPSRGWDAACRRVCTWAVLINKTTGEKYVHLNSHFDHIGITARRESVDMIIAKAQEFTDVPAVFTADMNVKEGSDNYKQFVNSEIFRDAKYAAPDTMNYLTFHDTNPSRHEDDIIDYVMINDGFEALRYKVVTEGIDGRYVSDHYPIFADLKIVK